MTNSAQRIPKKSGLQIRPRRYPSQKPAKTLGEPTPPLPELIPVQAGPPLGLESPPPSRKLSPFWRGLAWGLTVSLTAVLSATVGASVALVSPLAPQVTALIQKGESSWQEAFSFANGGPWRSLLPYQLSQPLNILVLGVDRVPDAQPGSSISLGGHSDTILLLHFNPSDHSLRMLSIPRDSRVEIPGLGMTKINNANGQGGPGLTARVVSKTLNDIAIDRYLRVTTDAFQQLVDLVGGVEIFVPYPMSYRDVSQGLEIDLPQGWQTLNGQQAEQFARFRKDGYGDIGRVQRQQILLKALQQRLYSPATLPRLPQIFHILQQQVDTNLTGEEILSLANFGRQLQREDIKMVMLPGRFSQPEEYDTSFWLISEPGKDRVLQEYFDLSQEGQTPLPRSPKRVRIALQNGTGNPEMAKAAIASLARQGYHNVYSLPDSPQLLSETEIVVQKGDLRAAAVLQNSLGVGRVEASSTGDLDSDLTLRLGTDAQRLPVGEGFTQPPQ